MRRKKKKIDSLPGASAPGILSACDKFSFMVLVRERERLMASPGGKLSPTEGR